MNIGILMMFASKELIDSYKSMYGVKTISDLIMKIRYEYYVLDKDRLGLYNGTS